MNRAHRSVIAVGTASLLCLFTAWSAVASSALSASAAVRSPAGGIKGDPQPELNPFKILNADTSPASIALEPNGSLAAAWDVPSGTTGKILVCLLNRGGHLCSHKADLGTLGLHVDGVYGPRLLVTSANHIAVFEDTCCDNNTSGDTLFYSSSNGGRTFGAAKRIGNVGTGAAVLIGKQIVFIGADFPQGVQVESIPVTPAGPPASVATLTSAQYGVAIGSYHGGVLAAWDVLGTTYTTYVDYAPSGHNFNASSSYHKVITIKNEQLIGMSGNALLTIQGGGKETWELRLFNGSSFGPAHAVPGTSGGGPEWWGLQQDPSGRVHVLSERAGTGYDLLDISTSNGTSWRKANLGNAITSFSFAAAIDSRHTGLVLGAGGNQVWGHPLLATQAVTFNLKSSTIKKGKSTIGSGKGSPASVGRLVTLQIERSGRWYNVATTHEKSGGAFSFTIKGTSVGKFSYRAVASDLAGYLQFGYSASRTLRVTS